MFVKPKQVILPMRKQFEMMDFKKTFLYIFVAYFTNFEVISAEEDSPSIIIIGAGAAGIAAASRLFENGFKKVTILEAENRIGGRIHTTKFNRYLVDLGAQYVFEEYSDNLFEIKWPFSSMAQEYFDNPKSIIYDSSGTRLNDEMVESIEEAFNHNAISWRTHTGDIRSVRVLMERVLGEYFDSCPDLKEQKGVIEMILMLNSGMFGVDITHMSPNNYIESCETHELVYNWKKRGYSTILDVMMKKYPNGGEELPVINNTILNTEVYLIENNLKDGKVIIKTTDGKTYCADHVIVTIPLGVLKEKYNTLFNPPLPEKKIKTIKGLGYGNEEKIFLFFQKPFWNYTHIKNEDIGFNLVWKDSDKAVLEKDPERKWVLGLHEFAFNIYRPKLLVSHVFGKYSLDMDKLSDKQILNHVTEVLQKFFGKDYKEVKPTKMIRSNWNTNKNFRGSCTYYKLQEPTDDDVFIEYLETPIGRRKPKILFAGEATQPRYFGSVRGAIYSGYREAERLTKLYKHLMQINEVKASSPP